MDKSKMETSGSSSSPTKPSSLANSSGQQKLSCKAYRNFKRRETVDLEFNAHGVIGQGTFGKVHRVAQLAVDGALLHSPSNDKTYALKIVHQDPAYCNRELDILEELRGHKNILHLEYSYYTRFDQSIYLNLITDLLGDTLYSKIYTNTRTTASNVKYYPSRVVVPFKIKESLVHNWSNDMVNGLAFMHSKNIAHRDLKPENMAFTSDGTLKIIDLGSAKVISRNATNSADICTLLYRAPELLLSNATYSCTLDMWAAACIIVEMISGRPLFYAATKSGLLDEIIKCIGLPPSRLTVHTPREICQALREIPINGSPQSNIRAKLPHLDVPENANHARLEDLLLALFKYEGRLTSEEAVSSSYFKHYEHNDTP